ncbi:MAG: hypothetical protein PWQ30_1200 [Euryarchaeota archaeon]|nr:hypothetical protein [Euryarchaeota archaeon]
MTIRRLFGRKLRILSRALRLISIRNVKIQLHKISLRLDTIHILDEPALLLQFHHAGEEIIKRLSRALEIGDVLPYTF